MKIFDEEGNLLGDFIESQKDDISDTGCLAAIPLILLKVIPLTLLFLIFWLIYKAVKFILKWLCLGGLWLLKKLGEGCLWLLPKLGVGCLWLAKQLLRCIWWLLRLPFTLIFRKKTPKF